MRLPDWLLRKKDTYERMIRDLEKRGYFVEHVGTAEILGNPKPDTIAVVYTSELQKRSPLKYNTKDILRDRPRNLMITNMNNGKASILQLEWKSR